MYPAYGTHHQLRSINGNKSQSTRYNIGLVCRANSEKSMFIYVTQRAFRNMDELEAGMSK